MSELREQKRRDVQSRFRREAGQSTVEFALSLMFMMGFVIFFVQLSFLFAFGNLAHYATFMAARAYLASGLSQEDQDQRAKDVIIKLLKQSEGMAGADKYPFIAHGFGGSDIAGLTVGAASQFDPKNRSLSWLQGVRYSFKGTLTTVPLGGGKDPNANALTLTSESWLGREHTEGECQGFMDKLKGGVAYDNGC